MACSEHEKRHYVATAAHCLRELPPADAASHPHERAVYNLLARLGEEPSISAEVVFVDSVADIALLTAPDPDALKEHAQYEAYMKLVGYGERWPALSGQVSR